MPAAPNTPPFAACEVGGAESKTSSVAVGQSLENRYFHVTRRLFSVTVWTGAWPSSAGTAVTVTATAKFGRPRRPAAGRGPAVPFGSKIGGVGVDRPEIDGGARVGAPTPASRMVTPGAETSLPVRPSTMVSTSAAQSV